MVNSKLVPLLSLAAILVSTASNAAEKVTYAVTTTNVTVGHAAQSSIPKGLGFWTEEGIDVEVISVNGSTAGIQQVASGQVDLATVGTEALLMARARGIKVKAVYTYAHKPIYQIVAPADSGIAKVEDLKGKTIGVPDMAAGSVPFARIILKASNIDPDKDVKWLAVGFGAPAANAFRQKDIQVWAAWDTVIAALENNGFRFNYIAPAWANEMPGNVVIARDDLLASNADRVIKTVRGIAKSSQFGLANPGAAVRNHWKMYPQTKPQGGDAEKAFKDALHIYDARFELMKIRPGAKWGQTDDAKWRQMADLWIAEGLLPKGFDVREAYTNQFIDEINKFDANKVAELAKNSTW